MAAAIPPPTPELTALVSVLGETNTRELARTFLRDTRRLLVDLATPAFPSDDPSPAQLAAHSLKSTARLVGAHALAMHAAALDLHLATPGAAPAPRALDAIRAEAARAHALITPFAGL
jgi:HPt (histidine-containing phosphotransfer) domain-containing protein